MILISLVRDGSTYHYWFFLSTSSASNVQSGLRTSVSIQNLQNFGSSLNTKVK